MDDPRSSEPLSECNTNSVKLKMSPHTEIFSPLEKCKDLSEIEKEVMSRSLIDAIMKKQDLITVR